MWCIIDFGKLKSRKLNETTVCYMLVYFQIKQSSKSDLHASESKQVARSLAYARIAQLRLVFKTQVF